MSYKNQQIAEVAEKLLARVSEGPSILRSPELKSLFDQIRTIDPSQRAEFGQEVNQLRQELQKHLEESQEQDEVVEAIDVTAPFDVNTAFDKQPRLLTADVGSQHPISLEIEVVSDIFRRMGFVIEPSRLIDDDYHMFDSLNFPPGHPARDDYDTFITEDGLIAPAHTSTMQNRLMKKYSSNLEQGEPIAILVPDRVFRNEDLDARHEHTFHQHEGIYVDKGVHAGMLVATLKTFFQEYYQKELDVKIQPFYFPFTEPSFEFAASCMFCDKQGCNICSYSGWIELGGCGMIHPNVLKEAGIDPEVYSGFAWGFGVERPIMLKSRIEDIRHLESGKLEFLRQFR